MGTTKPAIVFDLDGTLWDAAATCARGWNAALHDLCQGQQITAGTVRAFSGMRIHDVLQQYFSFVDPTLHTDLLEKYRVHESAFMNVYGGTLYPGAIDTLNKLHKDFQLHIVSNCLAGYIENFLRFHQLSHLFTDFECSGKTGLPKHENIRLLMYRNQISVGCYVGDTHWDEEAAGKNNLPFIFAAYGFGKSANPQYQISALDQLPGLILQLPLSTNHL